MTTDAPIEQLLDHLAMIREHLDDPDFQEVIEGDETAATTFRLLATECELLAKALRERLP
jgi:hypothetical protein